MKAKIDVTIFKNGDMDMLHASIYEELWKDYQALYRRAQFHSEKGTAKGLYLAKRYERAALLSLFAFFEGVVDNWMSQLIRTYPDEYGQTDMDGIIPKCDAILGYCFFCTYTKEQHDVTSLYDMIKRFEGHDVALLEHVDSQVLSKAEALMNAYFSYVEAITPLRRFPVPDESTVGLMDRLGNLVKGCH